MPSESEMGALTIIEAGIRATKMEVDGDEVERPRRFLGIIGEDGGSTGQDVVQVIVC